MSKEIKKLTYSNVVESIGVTYAGSGGYEYIASDHYDEGKFEFEPKSTYDRDDKAGVREANKELGEWKKGIRKLIKVAKAGPGAINMMAKAYTGNGPSNAWEYFNKLRKSMNYSEIIEFGKGEKTLMMESYVSGNIETWLE